MVFVEFSMKLLLICEKANFIAAGEWAIEMGTYVKPPELSSTEGSTSKIELVAVVEGKSVK